jgi:hypothetical protein
MPSSPQRAHSDEGIAVGEAVADMLSVEKRKEVGLAVTATATSPSCNDGQRPESTKVPGWRPFSLMQGSPAVKRQSALVL